MEDFLSYSYSASGSYYSDSDESYDSEGSLLTTLQEAKSDIGEIEDPDLIKKELFRLEGELEGLGLELCEFEGEISKGVNNAIWQHKVFFTELFDRFETEEPVVENFDCIDEVVRHLRAIRRIQPEEYKRQCVGTNATPLFEFFAERELREFDFLGKRPLIDQHWIRVLWGWTNEDGSQDCVPQLMETIGLPILIKKLRDLEFNKKDVQIIDLHIQEISDYCLNPSTAVKKLKTVINQKIRFMKLLNQE